MSVEPSASRATLRSWLAEPLAPEVRRALERLLRARDLCHVAVMPDVHLAQDVCNGVALATERTIYPTAVGGDIGCGMAALAFDADAAMLEDEERAAAVISLLSRLVPANKHGRDTAAKALPDELTERPLSDPRLERSKQRDGRVQLGTLGRGNHFLELQRCDEGRLWLMVHCGSRGIGRMIYEHHLRAASKDDVLPYLEVHSPEGQAYLADHDWALRYAELNRERMALAAEEVLRSVLGVSAAWDSFRQSNHNHLRRENLGSLGSQGSKGSQGLWVHRKGALPAHEGVPGVVPGSMGTSSYHVTGRGNVASLCSSSHGAGRRWSRSEARRNVSVERLEDQLHGIYYDHRLAHRLRDEAPSAYKDIQKVMRAQRELIRIIRRLWPLLCYKGG